MPVVPSGTFYMTTRLYVSSGLPVLACKTIVGVQEAAAHKVGAFKSGGRARGNGSGTDGRRVGSSKGKRGSGK